MLELCGEVYGKTVSGPEAEFWMKALRKYDAQRIEKVFNAHILESKFFPKPAEILEALGYVRPMAEVEW